MKYWKKLKRKQQVMIEISAAAVVVVVLLLILLFVGPKGNFVAKAFNTKAGRKEVSRGMINKEAQEVVSKYYEAVEDSNGETVIDLLYPQYVEKNFFEYQEITIEDRKEWESDDLEMMWQESMNIDATVYWEVKEVENLEDIDELKKYVEDDSNKIVDMDAFKTYVKNEFGDEFIDTAKISEVYAVHVTLSMDIYGEETTVDTVNYVYCYDGEWCLCSKNSGKLYAMIYSAI